VFDLIREHEIECAANNCGWVRSATTAKTLRELREIGRQWRARGHEVDDVSASEMTDLLGSDAYLGGVIDRRGGNIHPLNFALGLVAAAEKVGAHIYGDGRVIGVKATPDSVTVITAIGQVTAKRALICTNAYTGDLASPLGQTVVPVTSVQVATAPLSENVAKSILPRGHSPTDTRRLSFYFRKDAAGRFIMGGRGAMGDGGIRKRQEALKAAALHLYPQIGDATWAHAWGGNVAMTRDHAPGLHAIAPNIVAALGYNGRGVGMATAMGTVLAKWAQGMPPDALDFPMTEAKPIPFHRFRKIGVGATVATFKMLDRLGL
jgi:glycine/D-amino acid oxidase-like deaminating enzyme